MREKGFIPIILLGAIVVIVALIVVVFLFSRKEQLSLFQTKPKVTQTSAPTSQSIFDQTSNYKNPYGNELGSGLIFKNSPGSTVKNITVPGTETAYLIPEDDIGIRLFHNPLPGEVSDIGEVGYSESLYFSLPGKFNWKTSPIYNFLNDGCIKSGDCSSNNPYLKLLPPKRYEITNDANQKVGIVRYIAINNKTECVNCDTILSFEKRYILDFDTVTVWVKFYKPLLVSNPIPHSSNSYNQDLEDYIHNSINKLQTDENSDKEFITSDEFIRQISIDKNGYEFFNMTGSTFNNLCTPCKVEIQGLRMKLTQESGNKTYTRILEPKDISWLKNDSVLDNVVSKFKPIITSVEVQVGIDSVPEYPRNYMIRGKNLSEAIVHFNNIVPHVGGQGDDYLANPVSETELPKGTYEVYVETLFGESNKISKRIDI